MTWWDGPGQSSNQLVGWWNSFNDAELSRLIGLALKQSPDISSAIAAVREAQALRKASASSLFPSLDYSASRGISKVWKSDNGKSLQSFSAGLSTSWEADLFGKNQKQLLAADAGARAVEANLASARTSLAAETALAYLQLRAAESDFSLVQDSIRSQEETTQLAVWRRQAGQADALESDQAQSALASAQASLASLTQSIEQLKNRLTLLTGQAPRTLAISDGGAIPSPNDRLAKNIPTDTLRQRPDVRAAGYRWLQSIAQTEAVRAEQFPSLTLSGSLGVNSTGVTKVFNPESIAGNLVAGLVGPIFDAGRIRSRITAQNAVEEQAFHSYQKSLLTALSEVEDALIACRRSQEQIQSLVKASQFAQSAAKLAAEKYEAGVIDFSQVLETQRSEITLQRQLASSRLDYSSAHIALYRALGGGW